MKSFATDRALLEDERADPVERSAALDRLLADGVTDIEAILVSLLEHENELLRSDAIRALLGWLHLDRYVSVALVWLQDHTQTDMQQSAAYALGRYVEDTGNQSDTIKTKLARTLVCSNDRNVHSSCYEAILHAMGQSVVILPSDFELSRDVDWRIVSPLLERD